MNFAKTRQNNPSTFLLHRRVCKRFCRTQRKAIDKLCQNKAGQSFKFLLHRRVCQIVCRTQKKKTTEDYANTRQNSPSNFMLLRSLPDTLGLQVEDGCPKVADGTLGDCPGSQMSLTFLQSLKVICSVLFVYFAFDGVEDQIVTAAVFLKYYRK